MEGGQLLHCDLCSPGSNDKTHKVKENTKAPERVHSRDNEPQSRNVKASEESLEEKPEKPGEDRRSLEEPGGAWRSLEKPGEAWRSLEEAHYPCG